MVCSLVTAGRSSRVWLTPCWMAQQRWAIWLYRCGPDCGMLRLWRSIVHGCDVPYERWSARGTHTTTGVGRVMITTLAPPFQLERLGIIMQPDPNDPAA